MLIYQRIHITFILVLVSVLITDFFFRVNILWYLGIVLGWICLMAYGSANIRSGFYGKVLCFLNTDKKIIALTFDDGPDKRVTPLILDVLKAHNVKAAFFCVGHKAEENQELVRRIDHEGHIISGHSYSHHFFFDLFSSAKMFGELQKTENIIKELVNKEIKMFRPPYGVTNPPLGRALRKMNYHMVGWSLRSNDTVIKNEELLIRRVVRKLKPGSVVLFHDTMHHTVKVLDKFIIFAKENNYHFILPDELFGIEAYK